MRFVSTRGGVTPRSIDEALAAGLAPDGGLFVPESLPVLDEQVTHAGSASLAERALSILGPYMDGSAIGNKLSTICDRAFNFDAPLVPLHEPNSFVLELYHGPTAAFKDYAARFLAEAMTVLRGDSRDVLTILVATSGDTGAAVAAAFHRREGFRVVILYPEGRVSARQAHGLECWGENVHTFRVPGTFDNCQRMVKSALADNALRARVALSSANSISLGRLLPQAAYYAHSSRNHFARTGTSLGYIVPTGNLGNAAAALVARRMGFPVGDIVLATNANDILTRFFGGEDYSPQPTRATLANAMDVGAPSNFERLRYWFGSEASLRGALSAESVNDDEICRVIGTSPARHGVVPCPHTACAIHVLEKLRETGDRRPWAVVATAHPAKFSDIIEPLVGHHIEVPPSLAECLARPANSNVLSPVDSAFRELLLFL